MYGFQTFSEKVKKLFVCKWLIILNLYGVSILKMIENAEKAYEIFSIIDHNSRERNEYLLKCIAERYDSCDSEEERQQFSEDEEKCQNF